MDVCFRFFWLLGIKRPVAYLLMFSIAIVTHSVPSEKGACGIKWKAILTLREPTTPYCHSFDLPEMILEGRNFLVHFLPR